MDSIFRNATGQNSVKMSIYLAEDIRARFKSVCALKKRSMNEVLLGFIHAYINEKETPSSASKEKREL